MYECARVRMCIARCRTVQRASGLLFQNRFISIKTVSFVRLSPAAEPFNWVRHLIRYESETLGAIVPVYVKGAIASRPREVAPNRIEQIIV